MNTSFAALALGCALSITSLTTLAGAAAPEMGPTPSQMGVDPRTQGADMQRQGTDQDKGDAATGIRRGMNTGTDTRNNDADLPGGDTTGSGSTGSNSKGSSGSSSSAGGVGG
ncbi:hypothetical protein ACIPO9_23035 [Pseudomonas sp. NPDC090203]|uniref:hypothetical protein n=1 Tax=Pseudomonas sp. NPDC090203 TaxID=3364477 RepID=UPI003814A6C8